MYVPIGRYEDGAGVDFLGSGRRVGLAYYGTFKLTEHRLDSQVVSNLASGKNSVWAFGPVASLALAWGGKVRGFPTVRYEREMDAKLTAEGDAWNVARSCSRSTQFRSRKHPDAGSLMPTPAVS